MTMTFRLVLATLALALPATAPAQRMGRHSEAQEAFDGMRRGQLLPLRDIERRVVPSVPRAQYLGPDFDSESGIYTLKFLRDGNVIWVYVDGHSGQVLRRSGY